MTFDWFAGFFDGEGCVRLDMDKYAQLSVVQKDKAILRKIQAFIGSGRIYGKQDGRKGECYTLRWTGEEAVALAVRLAPVCLCKRRQLLLLVASYKYPSGGRRRHSGALIRAKGLASSINRFIARCSASLTE